MNQPASRTSAPESLPLGKQWLYAVGQLGWSALINLVGLQLVYFYIPPVNAETQAPVFPIYVTQATFLVVLNVIMLLATAGRLWDAITDPLIASWSDRLKHPKGRRIPFMAGGALPAAAFCALLFFPVVQAESGWNIAWLALVQALFFLFLTAYVTPFFALLPELGHNARERLNLSTWISITYALGIILASAAPALGGAIGGSLGLDAVGSFRAGVFLVCGIAAVCMFVPVFAINERRYCSAQPSEVGVFEALGRCVGNPHFRPYVVADFCYFMGLTMIQTGMLYYLTVLVGLVEDLLLPVMATILVLSFLFYYPVNLLAKRFGKKSLVLFAFVWFAAVFALVFFLGWWPLPNILQIFAVAALASVPMAILGVLPNAILADIAEHDGLRSGERQEGMYFAARTFLQKAGMGAGIMIFASLTNFGKDVGDDLGIRLSGVAGLLLCSAAFVIFLSYRERQVLNEIDDMESSGGK